MGVQVRINAHDMELSDRLRDTVTKKVSKLDRYLDILQEATVDLSYNESARDANDRQVAQLTIRGKGVLLRAEERTDDIYASVDAVMDKISKQIRRYKGRRWNRRGDGRSVADLAMENMQQEEELTEAETRIVRRKRFMLTPMDVQEAIEQMDLLGHEDFFVYLDAETNNTHVLYRRRDGTLGLIETEVG
jgi:putative sigma-54 modulation protein